MKYCIICLVFAVFFTLSSTQKVCNQGEFKLIPKDDCTGFYLCNWGLAIEMPDCPAGSVFSISGQSCVPIGSYYDDCKKSEQPINQRTNPKQNITWGNATKELGCNFLSEQPDTIQELCKAGADVIPHPTECQLYYNCSLWYNEVPRFFEQHLQECPYPLLFSTTTHRCEHFLNVQCGARTERKSACDYRQNQCGTSHCIPCSLRFPSCEGLLDGFNAHQQRLWTPYFAFCYKERLIHQGRCPTDRQGRPLIFSPEVRQCVPLERVPRQYGGLMPDCIGRVDGLYPDDSDTCHRYFMCRDGRFVFSAQCVVGEVFEPQNGACVPSQDSCGPCGNKLDWRCHLFGCSAAAIAVEEDDDDRVEVSLEMSFDFFIRLENTGLKSGLVAIIINGGEEVKGETVTDRAFLEYVRGLVAVPLFVERVVFFGVFFFFECEPVAPLFISGCLLDLGCFGFFSFGIGIPS